MKGEKNRLLWIFALSFIFIILGIMMYKTSQSQRQTPYPTFPQGEKERAHTAVFAGGCFWCMEGIFESQDGVIEAVSGYIGGSSETANYTDVSSGLTQHREAVQVRYNPEKISYETLVELYWTQIDPTDPEGQFADKGFQYTTALFYANEVEKSLAEASKNVLENSGRFEKSIATLILPLTDFYPAESYHQDYYKKSSFRYNLYKRGSGREGFIEENWKDRITELTPPTASQLSPSSKGMNKTSFEEGGTQRTEGAEIAGENGKIGEILEATYSDEALKAKLTPLQYKVTQEGGTERAFQNEYWDSQEAGIYVDIIDGTPLYSSLDKYDSGTGWPSFTKPISLENITTHEDNTFFSTRTEVKSASSDAHLGHVFPDGPVDAGGMRYCMNSAAMRFIPVADLEKEGYGEYKKLFETRN